MPNMKQTGTVNGNEFLRRRLAENKTVNVDISKFIKISKHNQEMEACKNKAEKIKKLLVKAIWFLGIVVGLLYLSNLI